MGLCGIAWQQTIYSFPYCGPKIQGVIFGALLQIVPNQVLCPSNHNNAVLQQTVCENTTKRKAFVVREGLRHDSTM